MEVLAKAGVLFFRFDTSAGVTFLTANVSGFLGYSREELMGDPDIVARVVDPSFLPQLLRMGAGFYVTSPEAIRVSIPFIARSGERVLLETRVVPDIAEGGAVVGFLGIALDAPQDARASLEIARGPRTEPA